MAAVSSIIGGAGLGLKAFGAIKGAKSAKKNARAADEALRRQQRAFDTIESTGQENLAFMRGEHGRVSSEYTQPLMGALRDEALQSRDPDFAAISADTSAAFDTAKKNEQVALERRGVDAGDGRFQANRRRYAIGESTAEILGRRAERESVDDERFNRIGTATTMAIPLEQTYAQGVSSASGGLMSGMSGVAAGQSANADRYGDAAAGAASSAFRQGSNFIDQAMDMFDFGEGG